MIDFRVPEEFGDSFAATLAERIPQALDTLGAFRAISSEDIRKMLSIEAKRQNFGCESDSCFTEIAGALGARYSLTGALAKVGSRYTLQFQLIDTQVAKVSARFSRDYTGPDEGLLDLVTTGTRFVVRDLLEQASGSLFVSVSEEGATIRVDERIVGVSPMGALNLAGGPHTLAVEKEGFISEFRDVEISAKTTTEANVTLRPSAEYLRKVQAKAKKQRVASYALFGGAGALAAGAIVTHFVGLDARGPRV